MKVTHQISNNAAGRLPPARLEEDYPMLFAATAPALLMLVLTLGLAALSMLETTPPPPASLRSSTPATISQPTPVPLDQSAYRAPSRSR